MVEIGQLLSNSGIITAFLYLYQDEEEASFKMIHPNKNNNKFDNWNVGLSPSLPWMFTCH